ncbi:MAG TPA: hypothetical protein VJ596_04610 [Gemmatimonadaceae bacterium]|nr:hypothetical protein [Gemmatimonadaceae bacterium]
MKSTSKRYETPVVSFSGDVVETTRFAVIGRLEVDLQPEESTGSVGFGL